MADATIYSPERVWSVSDNTLADALLRFVADNPTKEDEEVLQAFAESPAFNRAFSHDREVHVWKRLTTQYPHMFEVAEARRTLSQLRLDGHLGQTKPLEHTVASLRCGSWAVKLSDMTVFLKGNQMSPALVQFVVEVLSKQLLHKNSTAAVGNAFFLMNPANRQHIIRKLVSSAKTVLLPAWSIDAGSWAIVEMEALSPGCLSCVIHHWHKHKKAALDRLSNEVQMHCNIAKVQWKVYEINTSITHSLIFGVML